MKNQNFLKRLNYAIKGIRYALRNEKSFKTHVICACLAVLTLTILKPSPIWWVAFFIVIGFVMAAELINTAFECYLDEFYPEFHLSIGTIKDLLAGSVLLASVVALLTFIVFVFSQQNHLCSLWRTFFNT